MYRQDIAIRLYQRALRMNPQPVTLYPRVPPGTEPTSTAYPLQRATYIEEGRSSIEPGVLKKGTKEWTLYSLDLAAANAPNPKIDDVIQDAQTVRWTIKEIRTVGMDAAFICTTVKELPTNTAIN